MGIKIEKISTYKGNRYKLANACIKYSQIVSAVNEEAYKENNEKVVIPAVNDLLDEKIRFTDKPVELTEEDI